MSNMQQLPDNIIRYAYAKKWNKRIIISAQKCKDDSIAIVVETIRLIGDWKSRHIQRSRVVYGVETFWVVYEVFMLLSQDPAFIKAVNRELGQMEKDKMIVITDIMR